MITFTVSFSFLWSLEDNLQNINREKKLERSREKKQERLSRRQEKKPYIEQIHSK